MCDNDKIQDVNYELEVVEGRNKRTIKCKYCKSVILTPSSGSFHLSKFHLPLMKQSKSQISAPETEALEHFWEVGDIYTFYNVGFSNTVGSTKYLTCADCEAGPIGYHDIPTKKSYVALSRVDHL